MAGVKGRSGGGGKKSVAQHLAEGTYRPSRHGKLTNPPGGCTPMRKSGNESARRDVFALALNAQEQALADAISRVFGGYPPNMDIRLSLMVQNLNLYAEAHAEVLEHGQFSVNSKTGARMVSAAAKARDMHLNQLKSDFAAFGMSVSEMLVMKTLAEQARSSINKPSPGKALKS